MMRLVAMMVMIVVVIMVVVIVIAVRSADMVVIVLIDLQEGRVEFQHAIEVERTAVEDGIKRNARAGGLVNASVRVELTQRLLNLAQLLRRDEIGLVEHDDVGEGHLVLRFRRVSETVEEELGVDQRHDGVEMGNLRTSSSMKKVLGDRDGVGDAGGLHQDGIEAAAALGEVLNDADQVASHGAADAAVVHLEYFLVGIDHEVVVDADLAELVDDDGIALAMVLGEDTVEQRRLAGTEVASEDGDGDGRGGGPKRTCASPRI